MEKLPHLPKSLSSFRRPSPVSPSSVRMLKQVLITRDTSRFINLSSTFRNQHSINIGESPELSFQLSTLRKSLDKYSVSNFQKENRLRELKFKLKELKDSQIVKPDEIQRQKYYKDLKTEIKQIEGNMLDELEDQRILENMQERMRVTKGCLERQEKKLKKKLDFHSLDLDNKAKMRKETVDALNQYRVVYKTAAGQVDYEKSALADEISRMENQSVLKKKLIEKTEEHNRHRLEIVELTMIEERSVHLEEIRNAKLLHFAAYQFLRKRLEKEKIAFNKLNDAFLRVKVQTGLHDVDDVIEKFLTQEHNYSELIKNLHLKEKQCDLYKEKISKVQELVNELNEDKEMTAQNAELKDAFDELSRLKEKKQELHKLYQLINIWIENVWKKMNLSEEQLEGKSLKEKFFCFAKVVSGTVREYLKQGVCEENEKIRKKVKIQEIVQIHLAMSTIRINNKQKLLPDKALKTSHKLK